VPFIPFPEARPTESGTDGRTVLPKPLWTSTCHGDEAIEGITVQTEGKRWVGTIFASGGR
jgi:hypothetical protein